MGIKNLTTIIRHNAPNGINKIHLSEYRGKIIAIDTSIYLYKYIYNGNCLDGFVKQILRLFRNKIIPLYVFDGKPPEEKKEILNDRKQKRDQLILKKEELEEILEKIEKIENNKKDISIIKQTLSNDIIEEPLDTEISKESLYTEMSKEEIETEIKKINKRIIKVSYIDIENCKKLFNLFGVPYIVSDGEAEDLCSQLCSNGYVHGCMSEDTDILANGGLLFLRDFNSKLFVETIFGMSSNLINLCFSNFFTDVSSPNILNWAILLVGIIKKTGIIKQKLIKVLNMSN